MQVSYFGGNFDCSLTTVGNKPLFPPIHGNTPVDKSIADVAIGDIVFFIGAMTGAHYGTVLATNISLKIDGAQVQIIYCILPYLLITLTANQFGGK